jgi:hypothetical protein
MLIFFSVYLIKLHIVWFWLYPERRVNKNRGSSGCFHFHFALPRFLLVVLFWPGFPEHVNMHMQLVSRFVLARALYIAEDVASEFMTRFELSLDLKETHRVLATHHDRREMHGSHLFNIPGFSWSLYPERDMCSVKRCIASCIYLMYITMCIPCNPSRRWGGPLYVFDIYEHPVALV